ncbi:MAG TPA: hypothetical protein VKC60_02395 [Opitutaceae bacterium]|nr:hypothetical protein [Opitutaceae bacterium]
MSALLAVEYVVDGEAVAAIELHPGAYYEKHIESNDWDIPFDVYSGVPISKSLNGVIGGYFGRFVKHPIPIIGLIYQLNPQWRFEAIYPEPSINYKYNSRVSLKLGGELLGNGYRTSSSSDSGHLRTKLEFFDYRVGLHVITELNNISRLTIGAGYSVQRVFNFFDAHQEVHLKPAPFFKVGLEVNWPSNPR